MLLLCHFLIFVIFTNPSVSCSERSCKLRYDFLIFFSMFSGLSLMCHTCYSQKSGADCTRNVTPRNCSGILDVCMSVRRTATLTNGNTVHEFAKSCFMDGLCTHFFCEQKHDHEKKVVCHLDCCTTSLCNTRLGRIQKSCFSFNRFPCVLAFFKSEDQS